MDIPKPATSSQDSSAGEDMGDSSVIKIFMLTNAIVI